VTIFRRSDDYYLTFDSPTVFFWRAASGLVPRWGKLQADNMSRADVKVAMAAFGNQVLASAFAIFSWAIREELLKDNPARLVDRHKTASRERILSDSEIPKFWSAFDDAGLLQSTALKLSCQRADLFAFSGHARQLIELVFKNERRKYTEQFRTYLLKRLSRLL
jgi:integrase